MANPTSMNSFTNGTTAEASSVNANFDALYNWAVNQAIHKDGSKTFTALPNGPAGGAVPTTDVQLANKLYVDTMRNDIHLTSWEGSADLITAGFSTWPTSPTVAVPAWATRAIVTFMVQGVYVTNSCSAVGRVLFNGVASNESDFGLPTLYGGSPAGGGTFGTLYWGMIAEFDCSGSAGSSVAVTVQGKRTAGSGAPRARDAQIKVEFLP